MAWYRTAPAPSCILTATTFPTYGIATTTGDGVDDKDDLSPYSVSSFTSNRAFTFEQDDTDPSTLYIDFQIQPADSNHLRYSQFPRSTGRKMKKVRCATSMMSDEDINMVPFINQDRPNSKRRISGILSGLTLQSRWQTDVGMCQAIRFRMVGASPHFRLKWPMNPALGGYRLV